MPRSSGKKFLSDPAHVIELRQRQAAQQLERYQPVIDALVEQLAPHLVVKVETHDAGSKRIPDTRNESYQDTIYANSGTGTTPAVYKVASIPIWPLSVWCRLTTSAVVADRSVAVEYRDQNGNVRVVAGAPVTVAANAVQHFNWWPQVGTTTWPVEDAALAPLPTQYLASGDALAIRVSSGDAGDVIDEIRITARFVPVHWNQSPSADVSA